MVLLRDGPVTEPSLLIKKDETRGDEERRPRVSDDEDQDAEAATDVADDAEVSN